MNFMQNTALQHLDFMVAMQGMMKKISIYK